MSRAVRSVSKAFQKLYPKQLADSSWDNTGLLVDASSPSNDDSPSILLTIDLTSSVAQEAIDQNVNVIVAYHPFIFRGLKSITPLDCQQRSLLKLIQAGISVYCPHTAVDAAVGGVNDWLADGISQGKEKTREFLETVDTSNTGHEKAGMGRLVTLEEPVSLNELVKRVKSHLSLDTVQVVQAPRHKTEPISSVALCAGSGGSVMRGAKADVQFTGELGHHEMLHLKESGVSAIVCGHSNTERGFLPTLKKQLSEEIPDATISIAKTDADPIQYW